MPYPSQIILAEDNPADANLVLEALLEHEIPHELRVLTDGELAIEYVNQLDLDGSIPCPDLLLVDLHLPKYDGREILARLQASHRCRQTPVVILTASDWPRDRKIGEGNPSIHYFRKPNTLEEFLTLGSLVKTIFGAPKEARL